MPDWESPVSEDLRGSLQGIAIGSRIPSIYLLGSGIRPSIKLLLKRDISPEQVLWFTLIGAEDGVADARTGKRFPVELPIRIHMQNSENEQAGTTANVSAAGVYIRAENKAARKKSDDRPWRPGAIVEFDMTLPAEVIGSREDVHIHCRGRVVRVEKIKGTATTRDGVACVIDKYEFVRKSENHVETDIG